jgi:hypothetical protein
MRRLCRNLTPLLALALTACFDVGATDGGGGPGPNPNPNPTPGAVDAGGSTQGRTTLGIQALYTFNEGAGALVLDQSGNGVDLQIENTANTQWMPEGGLNVLQPTIIQSPTPASSIGISCQSSSAITIETWTRTAAINQTGPARVLTLSSGNNSRNFMLGQDNTVAEFRVRTTETDDNGTPATVSELAAFSGQLAHIAYTWSGIDDQADVWVDGQLAGSATLAGNMSTWDTGYTLALANEIGGDRPWRGELYLAAVYCRSLSAAEIFQNYQAGF